MVPIEYWWDFKRANKNASCIILVEVKKKKKKPSGNGF